MKIEKRDVTFDLKKAIDKENIIEGVFSTADIDRTGDPPIDQATWDLKNFKKNPVVLFAHDNHNIVVGKVIKIGLDEKNNLAGKIKFAVEEGVGVYGDFIKTLYNLYKNKFMRAFSVGFRVGEIVSDKKGTKMVNNELLEISCVPVPANAKALAKEKGIDLSPLEKIDVVEKMAEEAMKKKDVKLEDDTTSYSGDEEVQQDTEKRPYPNEHSCRLNDPKKYDTCRRKTRTSKKTKKEYSVLFCRRKDNDKWEEQAYRYNKDVWTESEARSHCKAHGGKFEPAAKEEELKKFDLYVDTEQKKIFVMDEGKKIGEGSILKKFRDKIFPPKVVTESPSGRKEESSKERIRKLNRIIRTLLREKQKVRSNPEKL